MLENSTKKICKDLFCSTNLLEYILSIVSYLLLSKARMYDKKTTNFYIKYSYAIVPLLFSAIVKFIQWAFSKNTCSGKSTL